MTSPSLLSRESTTLSPRWPQNGHFICGCSCRFRASSHVEGLLPGDARQATEAGYARAVLRHDDHTRDHAGQERDRVEDERRADRGVVGRVKERRHRDAIRLMKAAD